MSKIKVERLQETILREISNIIQTEMNDKKVGFVTVTDVRITSDLAIATIYVNFLGSDAREEAGLKALEHAKGFIRTELAKKLDIKKVPELIFKIDSSLEEGNKIEEIIKEINNEN